MKTYWYIKGDYGMVLKVTKLFFNDKKYNEFIKDSKQYFNRRVFGAFISDNAPNNNGFSYWIFTKPNHRLEMKEARDSYNEETIFEGSLSIKKGKLIKDTFERDIIRYNL